MKYKIAKKCGFGSTFPKGGKGGKGRLFRKIQQIFGSTFPKGGCG